MKENTSEYLPSILNLFAAACVFLFSFLIDFRFSLSREIAKTIGLFLVGIGMSMVLYATLYIKGAFLSEIEPRLKVLVKDGPYRMVRHPVYLGMTIALAGFPITLKSWAGLVGLLVLFLSSQVRRESLIEHVWK